MFPLGRSVAFGLAVTCASFATPAAAGNICPGGCPRSDEADIAIAGYGTVQSTLFGFTDADYVSPLLTAPSADDLTSCAQPGEVTTRRFEFSGDVEGLGPVRLWLDPSRASGGGISPQSLPQNAGAIQPAGGLFPANNDMLFYLRLDVPDLGLHLVNREPLHVQAAIDAWPPPQGTFYGLQRSVEFAERDPQTGAPTGPVLATINLGSHAYFYSAGDLSVSLSQVATSVSSVLLAAQISSLASSPLDVVWHAYSRERILSLGQPSTAVPEFGPQAGRAALPANGSQSVSLPVQVAQPGSEPVSFFAAAKSGTQIFGDRATVRAVLPDQGLSVSAVSSDDVVAGASVVLALSGTDLEPPFSVSTGDNNIQVTNIKLISPLKAEVTLSVLAAAAPGQRDLTVLSNGRQFRYVEAFTVTWPRPFLTQVVPAAVQGSSPFTLDVNGDFFLNPSFVSLGSNVTVQSVERISRQALRVTAQAAPGFTGAADVIVVGANGSAALAGALNVMP